MAKTHIAGISLACLVALTPLSAQRPRPRVQTPADSVARCFEVADSIFSTTARDQLPAAKPRGELTLLRTPTDAQLGRTVHSSVLVQPDGRADTTSVVVVGTEDAGYRRDFVRTMARTDFHAPLVKGCRVWGNYWLALGRDGVYRSP